MLFVARRGFLSVASLGWLMEALKGNMFLTGCKPVNSFAELVTGVRGRREPTPCRAVPISRGYIYRQEERRGSWLHISEATDESQLEG